MPYHYDEKGEKVEWTLPPDWRPDIIHYARRGIQMTDRITVAFDPNKTEYGSSLKDEATKSVHFGPAELHEKVRAGDILDVERTERKPNPKYPGTKSYNIISWKLYGSGKNNHKDQQELPIRPPSTRPRTDPKDQRQMWVTALMKEWMAAYAQLQSVTTSGEMKPMDAGVVEQAARVCGTVYDRLFGPMTRSNAPPAEDDMNDAIPDF